MSLPEQKPDTPSTDSIICPSCQAAVPAGSSLCIHCGVNVGTGERTALSTLAQAGSRDYDRFLVSESGPSTTDPRVQAAIAHTKRACVAGLLAAGLTLVTVLSALAGAQFVPEIGIDAWNLVDVALLLGLTFGVYRKSRVCAVLLLVYAIASYGYVWLVTERFRVLPLVFMYFYFQGVRGAFVYHSLCPRTEESPPRRRGLKIAAAAAGTLVVGVLGLLLAIGIVAPDTAVVPGPQMRKTHVSKIRSLGLLEPGETIRYFYSDALFDIEDGHYFLTDRKLVIYSRQYDEPALVLPFDEIAEVAAEWNDSFFIDSDIYVELKNGDLVWFPLSSEKGMDRMFYEALERAVGQR